MHSRARQANLMRRIWETGGETDSRRAHAHLRGTETPMSRATVINFLNKMSEEGFLTYRETTTKGGHKRLYRPGPDAPDEEGFRRALAKRLIDKAQTELLGAPPKRCVNSATDGP